MGRIQELSKKEVDKETLGSFTPQNGLLNRSINSANQENIGENDDEGGPS